MLHPHSEGKAFGFQEPALRGKHLIYIAGGMPRSKYDRRSGVAHAVRRAYFEGSGRTVDPYHPGLEVILPSVGEDTVADGFHHRRQPVRTYMRVSVGEDVLRSPEADQLGQHFPYIPPLGRACVEFTVREGSRSPFAVAVVGFGIHDAAAGELRHVIFAGMHILPPFQYHRLEPQHQQLEGGEHSGRARPCYHDRRSVRNIMILRQNKRLILPRSVSLVTVAADGILAGVDRTLDKDILKPPGLCFYFLLPWLPVQGAGDFELFHITPLPIISSSCAYQTANCPGVMPRWGESNSI